MRDEMSIDGWSPQGAVVELSDEASWELLASRTVGRLGISVSGLPDIFPVDYACLDRILVFRTDPGAKLNGLSRNSSVVFEVDAVDSGTTWSVVVKAHAEPLPDSDALARRAELILPPWIPTESYTWVALHSDSLRGRSFEHRLPIRRIDGVDSARDRPSATESHETSTA